MPLVNAKCPNCGSTVKVDPSTKMGKCPSCDAEFYVQDAIVNYNTYNTTNIAHQTVINQGEDFGSLLKRANVFYEIKDKENFVEVTDLMLKKFPDHPEGYVLKLKFFFDEINFDVNSKAIQDKVNAFNQIKDLSSTAVVKDIHSSAETYCSWACNALKSEDDMLLLAKKAKHFAEGDLLSEVVQYEKNFKKLHLFEDFMGSIQNTAADAFNSALDVDDAKQQRNGHRGKVLGFGIPSGALLLFSIVVLVSTKAKNFFGWVALIAGLVLFFGFFIKNLFRFLRAQKYLKSCVVVYKGYLPPLQDSLEMKLEDYED